MKDEVEEYMKINFENQWENAIDHLIRAARNLQKDYMENDGKQSGEAMLKELVLKSNFTMKNFLAINPAVIHYDKPYTLNIISNG